MKFFSDLYSFLYLFTCFDLKIYFINFLIFRYKKKNHRVTAKKNQKLLMDHIVTIKKNNLSSF
jgi:hypothetical protein